MHIIKFDNFRMMVILSMLSFILSSCMEDNNTQSNVDIDRPENYEDFEEWYETLFNTSWKLESSKTYYADGKIVDNTIPPSTADIDDIKMYNKYLSTVITLTSEFSGSAYKLLSSTVPGEGLWKINEDGELVMLDSYYNGNPGNITAYESGLKSRFFPSLGKIDICTSDNLVLINTSGEVCVFKRIIGTNDVNNGKEGDFYEINFSSIAYVDMITVKFYFSERISSASIKYGESSNCSSSTSAEISAKCAYATIKGLKSGTKYYFKCLANADSGQSCTSNTYPVMTNYK